MPKIIIQDFKRGIFTSEDTGKLLEYIKALMALAGAAAVLNEKLVVSKKKEMALYLPAADAGAYHDFIGAFWDLEKLEEPADDEPGENNINNEEEAL